MLPLPQDAWARAPHRSRTAATAIRAVSQIPQVGDHLAYGAAVRAVLCVRRRRRG
jgi:hypothetical protein